MRSRWHKLDIINVHSPTEDNYNEAKYVFYDHLNRLFYRFSSHDMKVVVGDFNSKVGGKTFSNLL